MNRIRSCAVISAAMMLSACGGSENAPVTVTQAPSTVTITDTPTAAPPALVQPSDAPVAPVAPVAPKLSAGPWAMPNLVGEDLQSAQNAIQALTDDKVFFSGSKDLRGEGRMQVNDRNWLVCTSTPPAGSIITEQTSVEFGVVKTGESCP